MFAEQCLLSSRAAAPLESRKNTVMGADAILLTGRIEISLALIHWNISKLSLLSHQLSHRLTGTTAREIELRHARSLAFRAMNGPGTCEFYARIAPHDRQPRPTRHVGLRA